MSMNHIPLALADHPDKEAEEREDLQLSEQQLFKFLQSNCKKYLKSRFFLRVVNMYQDEGNAFSMVVKVVVSHLVGKHKCSLDIN